MTNPLIKSHFSQPIGATADGKAVKASEPFNRLIDGLIHRGGGANAPTNAEIDARVNAMADDIAYLKAEAIAPGQTLIYAINLLSDEEKADVRTGTNPRINVTAKIQAAIDKARAEFQEVDGGPGGKGVRVLFHAGSWLLDGLILHPGDSLVGLASRMEVRFLQDSEAKQHFIYIVGRSSADKLKRRTDVFLCDIDLNANGNFADDGSPFHCIYSEPEEFGSDDDNAVNRTGIISDRISVGGASGWGFYSYKRGKNWIKDSQFSGNGGGGVYHHGPDSAFNKCYCGGNGGVQLQIFSSATPMIDDVEIGMSDQPDLYPSVWMQNCTDFVIRGGNCNGWIKIENSEGDTTEPDCGVFIRGIISNVIFAFKPKSFGFDETGALIDQPGYIQIVNSKGAHITGCEFNPAENKLQDAGGNWYYEYLYRPEYFVFTKGAGSFFTFNGPIPSITDPQWPAGAPTTWPGYYPANSYDSITNVASRALLVFTDPDPVTSAWVHDRMRFMPGGGIQGQTDGRAVPAGYIGERIMQDVDSASAVSLAGGSIANIAQVSLPEGCYSIYGTVVFKATAATISRVEAGISSSATAIFDTTAQRYAGSCKAAAGYSGVVDTLHVGPYEYRSDTADVRYLNARGTFSAGSVVAYGVLEAKRTY